ncbi:MAG: radical SAM family heme chaperone HemW [Gammaproteobacteria bacterium]|jgi:putative oxygen-independent coproporphyrinogen III oxidase|nr:radical SAM family heme chaperone HemW [Gammaproteobacteria bacterium]
MFNFTATPPLALYIHIPWCVRKCPYCDFNSHEVRDNLPEDHYLEALLADLDQELPSVWGRTLDSLFIGGGTPSLFSASGINQLLSEVRARIPLRPGAEITLEANPGTVDQARFSGYREAGINRLSLGVQSFQDGLLTAIGRIHDGSEALAAIRAARRAGFENINLDLMFGLPAQTTAEALLDLRTAMDLQPTHLSWYELSIEPNTWFYRHPPPRPADDALWEMQVAGRSLLEAAGYSRYEISAYAQQGRQCRHNLNYWQFGDYLGIGAGAHAKISNAATQTIIRTTKVKHPRSYLEQAHSMERISSSTVLSVDDVTLEFAINSLRLDSGFTKAAFTAATSLPFATIESRVESAIANEWLIKDKGFIKTTEKGQRYLNELLQQWLPESSPHAETR